MLWCFQRLQQQSNLTFLFVFFAVALKALGTLASVLGVEEAVLEQMLTQRVVKTRGEVFTKQLGVQDADLTRDAIVKSLYEVRRWVGVGGWVGG